MKHIQNKKLRIVTDCASSMWLPVVINIFSLAVVLTVQILTSIYMEQFANAVFTANADISIDKIAILLLLIAVNIVCVPAVGYLNDYLMLGKALSHDRKVFSRYLDTELVNNNLEEKGKIEYELEDVPNNLRLSFVNIASKSIFLPIALFTVLSFLWRINRILTVTLAILTVCKALLPLVFQKRIFTYVNKQKDFSAKRFQQEKEILANLSFISMWDLSQPLLVRIKNTYLSYFFKEEKPYVAFQTLQKSILAFWEQFSQIALLVLCAVLVSLNQLAPGHVLAVLFYWPMLQIVLGYIIDIYQQAPDFVESLNRMATFYDRDDEQPSCEINKIKSIICDEFSLLSDSKPLFPALDFSYSAGDKVCIVGHNGCGKSSLCRAISKTTEEYTGYIEVNGKNLKDIDSEIWYKVISYCPQDPFVFNVSVYENVAIGDLNAPPEQIQNILDLFGLSPIANQHASSTSLSGGECQKISLARALLKESDLVILDEPTNNLDVKSITALLDYLKCVDQNLIVVSHDAAVQSEMKLYRV